MTDELELIKAIAAIEGKLTAAMSVGLAGIQMQLQTLTEAHHKALLEQERRNASFVTRDRVDELERQVHELERQVTSRSLSSLSAVTGYMITLLIASGTTILTFVLTHLVH